MGARAESFPIRERLAGKWQIPLLFVSIALLVGSLLQIEPPETRIPFETLLKRIEAEIEGQMYSLAIGDCHRLLGTIQNRPEVEAHRGRVWVESPGYDEENCPGSRFCVFLPLRQSRTVEPVAQKTLGSVDHSKGLPNYSQN